MTEREVLALDILVRRTRDMAEAATDPSAQEVLANTYNAVVAMMNSALTMHDALHAAEAQVADLQAQVRRLTRLCQTLQMLVDAVDQGRRST
jgi:hypothetical protein